MFNLGVPELILILVIGLVVFGPKKLPEVGRSVGKGLKEFKKAMNDIKKTIDIESEFKEVAEIKKEVSDIKSGLKEVVLGSDSAPVSKSVTKDAAADGDEPEADESSPALAWVNNSPEWKPNWADELLDEQERLDAEKKAKGEQVAAEQVIVEQSDAVPPVKDEVLPEQKQATV